MKRVRVSPLYGTVTCSLNQPKFQSLHLLCHMIIFHAELWWVHRSHSLSALKGLKSPATWHIVRQLVEVNNRINLKPIITGPLWWESNGDQCSNKRPIMRKTFPCHKTTMSLNLPRVMKRMTSTVAINPRKLRNKTAIATKPTATVMPWDDFWQTRWHGDLGYWGMLNYPKLGALWIWFSFYIDNFILFDGGMPLDGHCLDCYPDTILCFSKYYNSPCSSMVWSNSYDDSVSSGME